MDKQKEEPPVPKQATGMKRVTEKEFFTKINKLNVHPTPEGPYNQVTGYVSVWKMLNYEQKVIGVSDGGTHLCENRFWLA